MRFMNIPDFDVVICGAGPVGLSIAALLRQRGMSATRIALIDAKSAAQAAQDPRSFALSYGSRQILDEIGVWPALAGAADEIHRIHVSRRGHFGRALIHREDHGLSALGYVLPYGVMTSALSTALDDSSITMLRPARVAMIEDACTLPQVHLDDGRSLSAAIVVQAEGGVFAGQPAKSMQRDYRQTAVVAQVEVSRPVAHGAFERFTGEGPLALLPYKDQYALVWCVRADTARHLSGLNDAGFLEALGKTFGARLGHFTHVGQRHSYPLGLNAASSASARVVAVGNAAQTLHPVAGQGLNLGLRDARVLAALLAMDCSPAAVQAFSRLRRDDRRLTIGLTDVMARIFAGTADGSLSQTLLGCSLGVLDVVAPAKHALARHFMFGWR